MKLWYFTLPALLGLLIVFWIPSSLCCNKALCASDVSKCLIQELCQCRPGEGNCSCCKECMLCLGTLWDECCDCVDIELNERIGKAATTFSRLTKRIWLNKKLMEHTKIQVYRACVLSTLLYCSESWTLYAQQKRKLNTFHKRCLQRRLGITRHDKISDAAVFERAGISSLYALLKQRRLRWLRHVVRMADGWISKDFLYGELVHEESPRGRPQLRYKNICKRDLNDLGIDINSWETLTSDRSTWRQKTQQCLLHFEETLVRQAESKTQSQNRQNLWALQGMCNPRNYSDTPPTSKSTVEELHEPIPSLFQALTEGDTQLNWNIVSFPVAEELSHHENLVSILETVNQHPNHNISVPNNNIHTSYSSEKDRMCTVVYFDDCMSINQCKKSCESMGASKYRWFHNACCECVGPECIDYGSKTVRCMNCMI